MLCGSVETRRDTVIIHTRYDWFGYLFQDISNTTVYSSLFQRRREVNTTAGKKNSCTCWLYAHRIVIGIRLPVVPAPNKLSMCRSIARYCWVSSRIARYCTVFKTPVLWLISFNRRLHPSANIKVTWKVKRRNQLSFLTHVMDWSTSTFLQFCLTYISRHNWTEEKHIT